MRISVSLRSLTNQICNVAELHDEKHQPDIKNGRSIGMPLDQFTEEAYAGLAAGHEQVPVGLAKGAFDGFESDRQKVFQSMVQRGPPK